MTDCEAEQVKRDFKALALELEGRMLAIIDEYRAYSGSESLCAMSALAYAFEAGLLEAAVTIACEDSKEAAVELLRASQVTIEQAISTAILGESGTA